LLFIHPLSNGIAVLYVAGGEVKISHKTLLRRGIHMVQLLLPAVLFLSFPEIVSVTDRPNDAGDRLIISVSMPDEVQDAAGLLVWRTPADQESWMLVMVEGLPLESEELVDGYDPDFPLLPGTSYHYMPGLLTLSGDTLRGPVFTNAEIPVGSWFHTGEVPTLVACLVFLALIFYYFQRAVRGANFYLRPIAGIEAIDEAIGRATEMGKPILYVPGLSTIDDVATIASLTILGRVARKVADYQTQIIVPNTDPIVYTVAEESVKQAYLEAGRPDSFDPNSVFFLTSSQFAYVAGVNGIMMRERPATNFYLGMFWAESLILAETGSLSGAIQIAGTDAVTQLPFFITTCDYTLIGEELYAASAYLGREPRQIGGIKSLDACKVIIMTLIILGVAAFIVDFVAGTGFLVMLRQAITTPEVM